MEFEQAWNGKPQIVLGIDVGTTQSAVAYTYLYPGGPHNVQRVTRWPGQESQRNESKIPSIVWYDSAQKARAFGAEARTAEAEETADDEGWELAQHFKLHLHPETMRAQSDIRVEPLPHDVPLEQIYADFLGYIFQHTETFFKDTTIDGPALWLQLHDSIIFVIAHPNGWDLREQTVLKRAAVKAGLVSTESQAESQIRFVTEAEASVHFVMVSADLEKNFRSGTEFLVCDAGGSTVDSTLYIVGATDPLLRLEELKASACVQAGAIFVNEFAKAHFRNVLSSAKLSSADTNEYIAEAVRVFEGDAKKSFESASEDKSIKVGPQKFTEASVGVKRGRLVVTGQQMEAFFSPCVDQILASVKEQMDGRQPKYILVVGGFGESPYLRKRLQNELSAFNLQVILANDSTAKAVSDGAVMWFVKQNVVARATRFCFGFEMSRRGTQEEANRLGRKLHSTTHGTRMYGSWHTIVRKGVVAPASDERSASFEQWYNGATRPTLSTYYLELFAIDSDTEPEWLRDPEGHLMPSIRKVCTVTADLSQVGDSLEREESDLGPYWTLNARIALKFGTTSLQAYLIWMEGEVERRGHASLIPAAFY